MPTWNSKLDVKQGIKHQVSITFCIQQNIHIYLEIGFICIFSFLNEAIINVFKIYLMYTLKDQNSKI